MSFSIVILARNEEKNLSELLPAVSWCDDVAVLDCFSLDRTVELAKSFGASVFQRRFDNFAGQRNWAIDNIGFKHPWVFHLDADERFTDGLRRECEAAVAADRHSGYYVPFKMIFLDRWLRHCGVWPGYQMRLMKIGEARFDQVGHGQRETDPRRGFGHLKEALLHHNFSKGMGDWREKHERYAADEAAEAVRLLKHGGMDWAGLFSADSLRRRRALKEVSIRLPGRPGLKFAYMYFLRLGFLDGRPGLDYCRLQAGYERMIVDKMRELRGRGH